MAEAASLPESSVSITSIQSGSTAVSSAVLFSSADIAAGAGASASSKKHETTEHCFERIRSFLLPPCTVFLNLPVVANSSRWFVGESYSGIFRPDPAGFVGKLASEPGAVFEESPLADYGEVTDNNSALAQANSLN
eukprot:1194808-Prorocentrum_minimum.AAC.1